MRLLYITNGICGAGGLERVLSIKTSWLIEKYNYDITILTLNEEMHKPFFRFNNNIKRVNLNVKFHSIFYPFQYIYGISKVVKNNQPDIIIVCDDGLKGFFLPLILRKPCPMVYERHVSKLISLNGRQETLFNKFVFWIMKNRSSTFDRLVLLTEGNKSEWKGLKNLLVIPNPLSFYPAENSKLDNKRIICVGKVTFQKGFDRLLEVWKLIYNKHPDWSIHIYGDIHDKGMLNQQIADSKIEHFQIHPATKNIEKIYREASIFAFPSRYEGFGMVLTEAMSYGVPCVSFDCPHGPFDILKESEDGFLVNNGSITDFAEKISLLIDNEELRKIMGVQAKKNVKRFLPEVIIDQWDELFKSITNPTDRYKR